MRVNEKMKKLLSILLCLCMLVQNAPVMAFAATTDNLCKHHTAHTAECGYAEAAAGSDCTHSHDGSCGYAQPVEEVLCTCEATDENGALVHTEGCGYVAPVAGADCTHNHDEHCGYAAPVEAKPCTYHCDICLGHDHDEEEQETTAPSSEATEPSSEATEPDPVCNCGTDDPAIHATTCAVYVAPETPQCFCVEKCTEVNEWCDVCGFDISKCGGEDTAAAYDTITSGTCGDNLTWTYDAGTLTISGSGAMADYEVDSLGFNNSPWSAYITSITDISLPEGLTSIGAYAFYGCNSLRELVIPGSVKTIGNSSIAPDTNITVHYLGTEGSVTLGTSAVLNTSLFHYCEEKETIEATCVAAGHEAGWYCTSCQKYITGAETAIDSDNHNMVNGVCTDCHYECTHEEHTDGTCTLCGVSGYVVSADADENVDIDIPYFVEKGKDCVAYITEEDGYVLTSNFKVLVGGTAIDDFYMVSGKLTIPAEQITGDIEISASAEKVDGDTSNIHYYFGLPVFTWAEDYSCTATLTCARIGCTHSETGTCTVASEVTVTSDCVTAAQTVYTATVNLNNKEFSDSKTVTGEKDPANHAKNTNTKYTPNEGDRTHSLICDQCKAAIQTGNHTFDETSTCTLCGYVCSHLSVHEDGCDVCQKPAVAYVENEEGSTTYYCDLSAALSYGDGVASLMADYTLTEDLTIPANMILNTNGHTLTVPEGMTLTNNGGLVFGDITQYSGEKGTYQKSDTATVKIGTRDGILFEKLYYLGALCEVSGSNIIGINLNTATPNTYYPAGDGYAIYEGDGTLRLHNAVITTPNSNGAGSVYAIYSSGDLTIYFSGNNYLTSGNTDDTNAGIYVEGDLNLIAEGENAALTVQCGNSGGSNPGIEAQSLTVNGGTVTAISGDADNSLVDGIQVKTNLTVNSGTVYAHGGSGGMSLGVVVTETSGTITVADGAALYATGGQGTMSAGVMAGTVSGNVNALGISQGGTDTAATFDFTVHGEVALTEDLTISNPYAGTEAEDEVTITFTVPAGTSLTVNENVTLDLSALDAKKIEFLGTVINNGTILLPEGFSWDSVPQGGTITIGNITRTWNGENWICGEDSHVTKTAENKATCEKKAVCDICGEEYGELAAHSFGTSDTCTYGCGTRAKARVYDAHNGNANYYYATLPEALTAAKELASDGVADFYGVYVFPLADYDGDFTIPAGLIDFNGGSYTFFGAVTNNGNIYGGTFNGTVTSNAKSQIHGGTFNGTVTNNTGGMIFGGTFNGDVINYGTVNNITSGKMELGEDFSIENHGSIDCQHHFWKDGACRLCAEPCEHTSTGDNAATCLKIAKCDTCGIEYGEPLAHEMNSTDGKCIHGCGKLMAVASTTVGTTTYYETLDAAIQAVKDCTAEDKATVRLEQSINLGASYQKVTGGVFTLDLNSHSLTGGDYGLHISGSTTHVTITDSGTGGTVSGTNKSRYGVYVNNSTVELTGGTVSGDRAVYVNDSTVEISGGTVSGDRAVYVNDSTVEITGGKISGSTYGVYVSYSTATISGGEISGGNYDLIRTGDSTIITLTLADGKTEGAVFNDGITVDSAPLAGILGEGLAYWQKGKQVTLTDGQLEITGGDVTVKAVCDHTGNTNKPTDAGNGQHSVTCSVCKNTVTGDHTGGEATCQNLAKCSTCGSEYGELGAHTPDANGKCTAENCGYQYAAKVGDSFYETIHKALRAAEGINGCTLTLLDNITLTSSSSNASYVNTGTFTLDLNGKNLSSDKRTLEVMGSADLTICDHVGGGKIVSTSSSAIYLSGGKLTIERGTFEGSLDGAFLSGSSTLTVKGGTFTGSRAMITGFGSNCVIDLTNIDPTGFTLKNNGSGTFAPKLPEGYGMVGSDGKLLTSLSAEQSATVHKHEYKNTDLGNGKHQQACSCGLYEGTEEAHTLIYALNEAGDTITAACSENCGYTGTAAISATGKTYDGTAVNVTIEKTGIWQNSEIPVKLTKNGAAFTGDPVDVGDYTASITLGEDENTVTASATFTIAKKELTAEDVTITLSPDSFFYDGSEKLPTVTIKLGDKTLDGGTYADGYTPDNTTCDYRLGLPLERVKPGRWAITVLFMNNYSGDAVVHYTITVPEAILSPAEPNGENGWYKDASLLAPSDYAISATKDGTFGARLPLSDGTYETINYWLTYPDNESCEPVSQTWTGSIKVDGTAPTVSATAGSVTDSTASITVTADDVLSGVASVTLTCADASVTIGALTDGAFPVSGMHPNRDYTFTLTAKDEADNETVTTVELTTEKGDSSVIEAPTAKTLTYTGQAQHLVTAGEASGGTMQYSTDNQTWSTTIPQGTNAGEYTVWYYVKGDDNHSDSAKVSVKVTIAKADPVIGTVDCNMALFDSTDISTVNLTRTDMSVDGTLILTDSELTAGEGTYNWKFTPDDTDNYNTITGTVTLTVTADVLESITATGTLVKSEFIYGDTFSIDGLTVTATYTSDATKDVTGLVEYSKTLSVGQTSVELTYQGKTCTVTGITVARKQLVISGMSWTVPTNAVYSGTVYAATLNGALPEGVTVTKTGDTATNAGSYIAKAVFSLAEGFSADNYEIVNGADLTADWSIEKAALTVTAASYESVRYGSAAPSFTANYSGFVNGEDEKVLGGTLVFSCEYDTADAAKRKTGDYPIVPSGLTSNNYEISYVNGNLEVIAANLVIVIDNKTVTYGDAAPEYTYHYEGFVYGEDISVMDEPGTVSCAYVPGNAVGTMEIKSDNYGSDDCYFVVNQRIGTLTVEKAPLTITAEDNSITYGDAPAANGVTGTGFVNGESFDDLSGELTYSYNYEQFGNVGTYKITPVGLTSDNYEITFADGTLTVNAKAITVTADAVSKTYGDTDPTLTYTAQGLVNGDELIGELKRVAGENVGSYAIEQNTLTAGNNYSITYTGANLTINAKAITEADVELNGSLTYTGKEQTQPITVTEGITYEVTGNKATNVGSYVLTVKGTGNYTGEVKLNWSIKEAAAIVTKAPAAKILTYTGTAQNLVNAGSANGGTMVYSLSENGQYTETIPTGANAGEYTVWYYVQGDDNHSDTAKASVKVTIAKADPVIGTVGCDMALFDSTAASAVELTRTDMSVEGTLVLTDSELTAGEGTYNWKFTPKDTNNYNTITGTVVLNVTADVLEKIEASGTLEKDSYSYGDTFSIDGLTVTATYTTGATKDVTELVSFDNTLAVGQTSVKLTYQGKTCTVTGFTVAKKQLIISGMAWDIPENAVYSGTAYNATLTGNLPEGVTVTKTGDTATNAGDYTAKAVFSLAEGYSADNYEIVNGENLTADWTIAKKNIAGATITLGTALTYNGKQQTQTVAKVEIDGLTVTYTVSGNTGTDAKGYTLTVTGNGNFEGTETKEWSIAKKNISGATITLGDSLTYNGNERTQEVTDVKIGELTVTYDVTANKQTNAGNYTLTVTGNGNFEGSATADWSIAKAKLTITANNNSITYGDIPAANGVTGTGFLSSESIEDLSGELTYSYNYEQFGNVGTYKITPSGVTSNNYEITFADGTLTVNAKAITVTADAVSKTYGDADPKLTYKVEGLVNGDELTGELKRVAGENVGDYAIEQNTLTAGNNYRLAYTGAKLTIKAKAITAADVKLNGSLTYNGKEQTQAITVTEGITYEVTGNKATNVGTYELTVKGTGNYTGSVTLDWTITKAKLTITADSKVIYIGEKLPTLTYTVSGLVGGDKLTKEPALITNADADQAGSYTITAANADAGMNYAITYVGGTLTIMDKNTEVETKVETAALTEVPDGLKNTKFNTVEAIKQELTSRIVATSTGFVKENMAHYDVTLQFSLDGGETWILATEENFPTEGIIVTLPYPYGTNAAGYDFVVSHMFTVTSQRLGTTAGDVELPSVTETASGIRVTLKGLSPVTLAWRATEFDVKIAGTTNGTVSTNVSKATSGTEITVTVTPKYGYKMATLTVKDASGKSYAVSTDNSGKYYFTMPSADVTVTATFSKISSSTADTTNPKTGDDFQLMLWSSILSTSAIFLLAALADQKRKLIK